MSYDLLFMTVEGQDVSPDDMKAWLRERKGYEVEDDRALFTSPETGFVLRFSVRAEPEDRTVATFSVNTPAPEIIVQEVEREVGAFASHFALQVWDQQIGDGALGPHSRERLLRDFATYNRFQYLTYYGYLGGTPEATVSRDVWRRVWLWNTEARRLEPDDDEAPFVPQIMLVRMGDRMGTAVALPMAMDMRLPEVDYIITARSGPIAFASVLPALVLEAQESDPIPHWRLAPVPEAFQLVFDAAQKAEGDLSMPNAQSVLTAELVAEVLAELKAQAEETERMRQAAQAYNTARYEEALQLCLTINGQHARIASLLRAVAEGELARYDECLADFAAYLASNDSDAMAWNSYGYFLSALGSKAEASAAYEKALALLEIAIAEAPERADLWSRKAYGLLGLGRAHEALSAAERGVELAPDNALVTQHRGRAHLDLEQWAAAKEWLEKAVALDEHNPYARFYLARVLGHLGDADGAAAHAARVRAVSPHLSRSV